MTNSFENMQKLAFGKVLIKESMESKKMSKSALKAHIREMILDEAKKKKSKPEDVAPQEDVDIDLNMGDEQLPAEPAGEEAPPMDTMAPEADTIGDIDPTVKSIQDSLQKAFAQAKTLGDEKLMNQIGNTITMLVRTQVLGQQQMAESINENIDWNDDQIYNSLIDMNQEQLVSDMLSTVEENPSITLLEYCKQYED
jgi:hypothetical protein